eukprot:TRINITY_DN74612_c0_g1_i1.p1 TRINITY_DN74612_c0_g1~~TRINITY_DN74612_c0_g1_i1.p1  ORF type:complete len:223 (-),score=63.53 TRINITY_DN74612_c0_g1_i1:47-715(-)
MGAHPVPSVAEAVAKVKKQKKDVKELKKDKKEKKEDKKKVNKVVNTSAKKIFLSINCKVQGKTIPIQSICVKDNIILGSVLNAWATGILGCDLPLEARVYASSERDELDLREPLHLVRNKLPARAGRLMVTVSMEAKQWDRLTKAKEDAIKAAEPKKGKGKGGGYVPQPKIKKVATPPMKPLKERIGSDHFGEEDEYNKDAEALDDIDEDAGAAALEELLSW